MITGDNPLTAVHVARDVEIVDRDALILDLKENPAHEAGQWRFLEHNLPYLISRFSQILFGTRSTTARSSLSTHRNHWTPPCSIITTSASPARR